jgi:TRAP transporter TAXI family solute receptor
MKDGKLDAFFWVGGVPTGSVLDLASTPGRSMRLLSSEDVIPEMQRKYGAQLYRPLRIAKSSYPRMEADVVAVGLANVLVVDEKMSEQLAYDVTRILFDHRDELVAIHDVARELRLETAPVGSPVPFHPGSIRYYREKGVWKDA